MPFAATSRSPGDLGLGRFDGVSSMIRRTSIPLLTQSREYYVDAAEAARFLCIHPRTLQQLARAGIVPAHPLGCGPRRFWRFLLSELDDWLRSRIDSSRGAVRVIAQKRKVQ